MQRHEPIFNVPGVVLVLLGLCCVVHVLRWLLPGDEDAWLTAALAFIPMRLVSGVAMQLPGGETATVTSFVTHLFVHGDTTHLLVNMAWLLAFGSPVARRTDALRFLAFFFLCGIAGTLFYILVNGRVLTLVVGASGAISGLMGGAMRFFFRGLGPGSAPRMGMPIDAAPLMSLAETVHDKRIVLAIVGWTILNILLAWGAAGLTDAAGIAWEAHVGGFYAGLLLYGLFDRAPIDKIEQPQCCGRGIGLLRLSMKLPTILGRVMPNAQQAHRLRRRRKASRSDLCGKPVRSLLKRMGGYCHERCCYPSPQGSRRDDRRAGRDAARDRHQAVGQAHRRHRGRGCSGRGGRHHL